MLTDGQHECFKMVLENPQHLVELVIDYCAANLEQTPFEIQLLPASVPFSLILQRSQSCWLNVDRIPVSMLKGPVYVNKRKYNIFLIINIVKMQHS